MTITTINSHLDGIRSTWNATATKPGGSRWTALRTFLASALADGVTCPQCGIDAATVVCHVIPATYGQDGKRRGYVAGNLFLGCEACNDATGDDEPDVSRFAYPAGVPAVWPVLRETGTGDRHAAGIARRRLLEERGIL